MPPIKCLAVRKGAFPLGGRSSRAPSASAGGSPRRSRGCGRNNAAARCRAAARPDHRAGALGRRLQAQPDHGAAIRLAGQIDTLKSGKTRRVPMTARLAVALQAIRHLRGPRAFYQHNGKLISANTLRSWMQRAQARAGLPLTSGVHILRHTFCSHLAMRGAPVRAIQELAGHADLSTTMRYMHLSPASLNQAIRLLEQRLLRGENGESGTPPQENTSNSHWMWRPHRDSNSGYRRERAVSWASRRWGRLGRAPV
jgi:Phage integrase family